MSDIYKEKALEDGICEHLASHGWLYNSDVRYDKKFTLFPEDALAWIQETQPEKWAELKRFRGRNAETVFLEQLRNNLNDEGTLKVLKKGFSVPSNVYMCKFQPSINANAQDLIHYEANRLRVSRQVRYSLTKDDSIDLVLSLNGIPLFTVELKSDYTQGVGHAVEQYKKDRSPKDNKGSYEPLLSFPGGALAHFAVSNSEVQLCTKLAGKDSRFLPFNKGYEKGAGNPPNPLGSPTAYLWEDIWERHSILDIIGRYIFMDKDGQNNKSWIFPRYHQLDGTRALIKDIQDSGLGKRYLFQHSAGSGKTNSIAWATHRLSDMTNADGRKMFSNVLVVSDRKILDQQLTKAIEDMDRPDGVVKSIRGDSGSKSKELIEALQANIPVIVCTLQTFPFALERLCKLSEMEGRNFAIVADEAHSSQSGKSAKKMRSINSYEQSEDNDEDDEDIIGDIVSETMLSHREASKKITMVAFTATPKEVTLEIFGTPKLEADETSGSLKRPFHEYSMRQAIEEGFILDVLKNYGTQRMIYQLATMTQDSAQTEVSSRYARRDIESWVSHNPELLGKRAEVVIEHFRNKVANLIGGKAKAMVVAKDRRQAIIWTHMLRDYIAQKNYKIGVLVAFSGEVDDKEISENSLTEANMNPNVSGDLTRAFDTDDYQILVVANKYQTGFDQKKLCAMYVGRKLTGVQAVQTLSRLNRSYSSGQYTKTITHVLDFENEPVDILKAFQVYYETAELKSDPDPFIVVRLRDKIKETFSEKAINDIVTCYLNGRSQPELDLLIAPIVVKIKDSYKQAKRISETADEDSRQYSDALSEMSELKGIRQNLNAYVREYEFMSQVVDYNNAEFEKFYCFADLMRRVIKYPEDIIHTDLSSLILLHPEQIGGMTHKMELISKKTETMELTSQMPKPAPVMLDEKIVLHQLLERINQEKLGLRGHSKDKDTFLMLVMSKLCQIKELRCQATSNNTPSQFEHSETLSKAMIDAIMSIIDVSSDLGTQALQSETVLKQMIKELMEAGLMDVLAKARD
jgi:type I restriction enzyme, R subunit